MGHLEEVWIAFRGPQTSWLELRTKRIFVDRVQKFCQVLWVASDKIDVL